MKKIILASASPRRKRLLEHLGIKFSVDASNFEEDLSLKLEPKKLAEFLSCQKAKTVAKKYKDAIIIAADTFVVLGNEIIGKPHTEKEAIDMLKKLSDKQHLVITGLTIIDTKLNKTVTCSEITKVYLKKLTNKEISRYVASKEPLNKAGAYAIQDLASLFVEKIEGDYYNIVGLPLFRLSESLKGFGVNLL